MDLVAINTQMKGPSLFGIPRLELKTDSLLKAVYALSNSYMFVRFQFMLVRFAMSIKKPKDPGKDEGNQGPIHLLYATVVGRV